MEPDHTEKKTVAVNVPAANIVPPDPKDYEYLPPASDPEKIAVPMDHKPRARADFDQSVDAASTEEYKKYEGYDSLGTRTDDPNQPRDPRQTDVSRQRSHRILDAQREVSGGDSAIRLIAQICADVCGAMTEAKAMGELPPDAPRREATPQDVERWDADAYVEGVRYYLDNPDAEPGTAYDATRRLAAANQPAPPAYAQLPLEDKLIDIVTHAVVHGIID